MLFDEHETGGNPVRRIAISVPTALTAVALAAGLAFAAVTWHSGPTVTFNGTTSVNATGDGSGFGNQPAAATLTVNASVGTPQIHKVDIYNTDAVAEDEEGDDDEDNAEGGAVLGDLITFRILGLTNVVDIEIIDDQQLKSLKTVPTKSSSKEKIQVGELSSMGGSMRPRNCVAELGWLFIRLDGFFEFPRVNGVDQSIHICGPMIRGREFVDACSL